MKKLALAAALLSSLALAGCFGNSAVDNEVIGQAKKIINVTPLVCMDYKVLDVSLGVMRNGTGSMSAQDMFFVVENVQDLAAMKKAVEDGSLVKVRYSTTRWAPCSSHDVMTAVEVVKN